MTSTPPARDLSATEPEAGSIPAVPGGATELPSPAGDASTRTLVTFRLACQRYALPLECVERVVRMVAITTVPEAPPEVLGLIDVQGEVIPVLDIRYRLRLARQPPRVDDRLVIVRVARRAIAFAVDEACTVLTVPANLVESPPPAVESAKPLSAVIRRADGLLLVLDETRLLLPDEAWPESPEGIPSDVASADPPDEGGPGG